MTSSALKINTDDETIVSALADKANIKFGIRWLQGDVATYYANTTYAKALLNWEANLGLVGLCRDS